MAVPQITGVCCWSPTVHESVVHVAGPWFNQRSLCDLFLEKFPSTIRFKCKMSPHTSAAERDTIRKMYADHLSCEKILIAINKSRRRSKIDELSIDAVRRYVRGHTHKAGAFEKRGRKAILGRRAVLASNAAQKALAKKAKGEHEVRG